MHAGVQHAGLTLNDPHVAAHGSTLARSLLLFDVSDGIHTGWGEASPLPGYSSATLKECESALLHAASLARDADPDVPEALLDRLPSDFPNPARAAVEVALRDLAARRAEMPLWRMLGGRSGSTIPASRLIGAADPAGTRTLAEHAVASGFSALKIKVGMRDDVATTAAVRSVIGPDAILIADANCAWSEEAAPGHVACLVEAGASLVEQPAAGIDAMRSLTSQGLPVSLDEDATDADAFTWPRVAAFACLKLQALGGMDAMIEAAASARKTGIKVYAGSTLDGPIGIAASLHAAAVITPDIPSGLATIDSFVETSHLGWTSNGEVAVPEGNGLGIDPLGTPC